MSWFDVPYPGGTPTVKHALPRPLYPPDATKQGKKPSSDGPDALAWKRSLSRGGRWMPFDPASWDDSWSNAIAHGRGTGNVGDSGAAGFQRQMDIDDTGWIGTKSWDALRYALIPADLPHAGEHLIDSVAAQLFAEAWRMFGGREPPPVDTGSVRVAALKKAISQLGVKESPPNSNRCKYTAWYNLVGPWCAIFTTWSYELGASDVHKQAPSFVRGQRYAYVPFIVADARASVNGLRTTDDPIPGDLACFDWDVTGYGAEYDHVGIFERWLSEPSTFSCIEGNTSLGNDSNGGQVMRRTRNARNQGTVFVRVREP